MRHEVVHFLGPPGTGKNHLAVALGVEAVKAGHSVYFCALADLLGQLDTSRNGVFGPAEVAAGAWRVICCVTVGRLAPGGAEFAGFAMSCGCRNGGLSDEPDHSGDV